MKMYELVGNYNQVWDMINSGETDLQTIQDTLESIEAAIEVKAENSVYLDKNLEVDSNGLKAEVERLEAKINAIENTRESIRNNMFRNLELAGLTEIKTKIATIKQQKNPASVVIEDESLIPAAYQTVVPESYKIRKADIAKVLKAGFDVPGATLQQSTRWVIK